MTEEGFRDFMREMRTAYGKKNDAFTAALIDQYRRVCQSIEVKDKLYQDCLRTFKWFPSVSELYDLSAKYKTPEIKLSNTNRCFYCMDAGTIPYIKKGFPPFSDTEYEFRAACPRCNIGKKYAHSWITFDSIFSDHVLEDLKQKNLDIYGNITVEQAQADRINARSTYFGAIVGKNY